MTWSSLLFVPLSAAFKDLGIHWTRVSKKWCDCCLVPRALCWEGGILRPGPCLYIINLVLNEKCKDVNGTNSSSFHWNTVSTTGFLWRPQFISVCWAWPESTHWICFLGGRKLRNTLFLNPDCTQEKKTLWTQILAVLHFCRSNLQPGTVSSKKGSSDFSHQV